MWPFILHTKCIAWQRTAVVQARAASTFLLSSRFFRLLVVGAVGSGETPSGAPADFPASRELVLWGHPSFSDAVRLRSLLVLPFVVPLFPLSPLSFFRPPSSLSSTPVLTDPPPPPAQTLSNIVFSYAGTAAFLPIASKLSRHYWWLWRGIKQKTNSTRVKLE
jgi:hypothetical protein